MPRPEPKNEIVVTKCPNPQALSIECASKRAAKWVISEGSHFTSDSLWLMFRKRDREDPPVPFNTVLAVSPCFDVDDVKRHLESPDYGALLSPLAELK